MPDQRGEILVQVLIGEVRLQIVEIPAGDLVRMGAGIFVDLDIRLGEAADGVLVGLEERTIDAKHTAEMPLEQAGLRVGDLEQIELLAQAPGPRIEMDERIGLAALDCLAEQVERRHRPVDVPLGIEARLRQRDLERMLRRARRIIGDDRLALEAGERRDAGFLRGEQTRAAAMRADEQLDVEPLLQGLQPVEQQPGAGIGLVGRERLDESLAACALIEEFDVEIVLGIEALGETEGQRTMAGRDLCPGEAQLCRVAGNGAGHAAATGEAERCSGNAGAGKLQCRSTRKAGLGTRSFVQSAGGDGRPAQCHDAILGSTD